MIDLQQKLDEMNHFLDRTVGIIGEDGRIVASTDHALTDTQDPAVRALLASGDEQSFASGRTYRTMTRLNGERMICFVSGTDSVSEAYAGLLVNWLESTLRCVEGFAVRGAKERKAFLKNVLLENELPGDIPLKAREFRVKYSVRRIVLVVSMKHEEHKACLETIEQRFADRPDDFVLPIDEGSIVIMMEVPESQDDELDQFMQELIEAIKEEAMADVKIGVSMPSPSLQNIAKAYRDASLALTVGDIFSDDPQGEKIRRYDRLGLGRLIYQLPITLCELFLNEVFEPGKYEELEPETLLTIQKFFENSLNGSETSRQLFVHRNTLVYRLDKVEKITGLDLRNFEDAVLFKLAEMVRKYLTYVENNKKS
ncbi:MAG: PucR family transcriptional regulator [Clostridiaceae bacterium]|jgi:carbohydrate diacid regulator|nr:PucR family transcriptional regulator [Clostridiaceae bacterium]